MRLLNVNTKLLEEFLGDAPGTVPRYAILSHTWGRNEVSFKDVEAHGYQSGSVKIDGCCEQAIKDHLEYVWIDTCCIDKSSSAELSEAINSMFNWYREAEVCYAYLSDVHPGSKDHGQERPDLRKSRWFTRGWTLQELIAPRVVNFYDSGWAFIGAKQRMARTPEFLSIIRQITGISGPVLIGNDHIGSLERASIAQKMSWASNRKTTRSEDVAYSLLGIFGVNMPLLYGEGSRAFIRLQEEIIKTSNDESIFAWGFLQIPTARDLKKNIIFSTSPQAFQNCGEIVPYLTGEVKTSHYSLTNKGLHLELGVCELEKWARTRVRVSIGRLNCSLISDLSKRIALPLTRSPGDDISYYRTGMPILISSDLLRRTTGTGPNAYLQRTLPSTMDAYYPGFYINFRRLGKSHDIEKRPSSEVYPPLWRGILYRASRPVTCISVSPNDIGEQIIFFLCPGFKNNSNVAIRLEYAYFQVPGGFRNESSISKLKPERLLCRAAFIPVGISLAEFLIDNSAVGCNWQDRLEDKDDGIELVFELHKSISSARDNWILHILIREFGTKDMR